MQTYNYDIVVILEMILFMPGTFVQTVYCTSCNTGRLVTGVSYLF